MRADYIHDKQQRSELFNHFKSLLSRIFLPRKFENVRPILVTLLKMHSQYSQSSSENATQSGGT